MLLPGFQAGGSSVVDVDAPNCDLSAPSVQALRVPALSGLLSRKQFDELAASWASDTAGVFATERQHQHQQRAAAASNLSIGASGPPNAEFLRNLSFVRVKKKKQADHGLGSSAYAWQSPLSKHVGDDVVQQVSAEVGAQDGDLIVLAVGRGWEPHTALGRLRLVSSPMRTHTPYFAGMNE